MRRRPSFWQSIRRAARPTKQPAVTVIRQGDDSPPPPGCHDVQRNGKGELACVRCDQALNAAMFNTPCVEQSTTLFPLPEDPGQTHH